MTVTLSMIAKKTGFSINTVSRALRGDERLSVDTREKIKSVAENMGYIRNYAASSMRSHTSNILGVISADSSNPFFAEVILGIEETAKQYGYHILLMNTEENLKNEYEALKTLTGRQVDGIISIPVYQDDLLKKMYEDLSVPYVFAGRKLYGLESHSILHSDKESAEEIVSYLIQNGHKKILYITGPVLISNSFDRLASYVQAFKNANYEINKDLIIKTNGHIDDGYGAVNVAVKKQLDFTAVVCFNDLVAMGVLKSLYENNYSVPNDVEVFGFDNLSISQYMQPRLSTVDIPKYKLGRESVLELINHIDNKDLPYEMKNLDTRMILRESTKNRLIN